MTRRLITCIVIAGTPIAWITGAFLSKRVRVAYAQTSPVVFTAEYVVKTRDTTGAVRHSTAHLYARRGDGSIVNVTKSINGRDRGLKRVFDSSSGTSITVDPLTGSRTTYHFTEAEVQYLRSPRSACMEHPKMILDPRPQAKMLGYDVVHFSGEFHPGSDHTAERWYAPSLNCFMLGEEILSPGGLKTTRTTSAVVIGEPDPSLFEIPADYVERTPSEVLALARGNNVLSESGRRTNSLLDSVYQARRPRR